MNDQQIGTLLRTQILADLQRGLPIDGRRLQAVVGDLCADRQRALLPALRHLVMSPAFSRAVEQTPPLAPDPQAQLTLQQELEQVFTTAICERMQAVLSGLLALPEIPAPAAPAPMAMPASPAVAIRQTPPAAPVSEAEAAAAAARSAAWLEEQIQSASSRSERSGGRGIVAVLSFLAGVLMIGTLGALGWLLQLSGQAPRNDPAELLPPVTPPPAATNEAETTTTPQSSEPPAPELSPQADPQAAAAAVQQLYTDISAGNMTAARQRLGPAAAEQFDPAFYSQFQQVSVSELRELSRDGSRIGLEGVVTFVYPDGTSQSETRSFTVETASQPAVITDSSFGRVTRPRS